MRITFQLLAIFPLLFLAACSHSPDQQIVGRWSEVGTGAIAAFHEDGTVEASTGQSEASGKYSFITSSELKLEVAGKGGPVGPRVFEVTFAGEKMTWKDVDGAISEYRRMK
jgi:hypothetical protein